MNETVCPFCGLISSEEYAIRLHIEEYHTDNSPFKIGVGQSDGVNFHDKNGDGAERELESNEDWIKCSHSGCGEYVSVADIYEHLTLHIATDAEGDESKSPKFDRSRRSTRRSEPSQAADRAKLRKANKASSQNGSRPGAGLLDYFSGSLSYGKSRAYQLRKPRQPGRLGKRELGPHAFEEVMPPEVRRHLLLDAMPRHANRIGKDGRLYRELTVNNETSGLIPVLADLCALNSSTAATYLCSPLVKHILKLQCDGNFCGYWNIQVLLSYVQQVTNTPDLSQMPNVLQIQDQIEQAWDNGICMYGRVETGGLRGTRKWIGTHEALAFFTQMQVKVDAVSFREEKENPTQFAVPSLLDYVEAYFMSGLETAKSHGTSHITKLAPMYFQRLGHSMTIVGLERMKNGSRNLLVFDSSFATSEPVKRLLAGRKAYATPDTLLKAYRRSDESLTKWNEFEIVV